MISGPGLVPVHVGQPVPLSEQDLSLRERATHFDEWGRRASPLLHVPSDLAWEGVGLQPRWLGMESSDCAVALEPGRFSGRGSEERDRFLAGAAHRTETALIISVIGDREAEPIRNVFSRADASVDVGGYTQISGRRLPPGSATEVFPSLGKADRDLALRMRNREPTAPWWALDLSGSTVLHSGYGASTVVRPKGRLEPILVNNLDEPVVAVWVSDDERQRWYILPDGLDWTTTLDWLQQRALPEFVPDALRRVRSPRFLDPDLQTRLEMQATRELRDMKSRHTAEKVELEKELEVARASADAMRNGLLYESGTPLAEAVQAVLRAAGLHVIDLDDALGDTVSADLLVSPTATGGPRYLIEVKGVGGAAPERLVQALERHLATWPELRPHEPVAGGVLVVNHQHKLDPTERSKQVYQRSQFAGSLSVAVLSSRQLFDLWREEDWTAISEVVLGDRPAETSGISQSRAIVANTATDSSPSTRAKRWWRLFM